MRKDLKAPETYPKKQSLHTMHQSFKSSSFSSAIVDFDISHEDQIMVYN
jgi:hypothetical protein